MNPIWFGVVQQFDWQDTLRVVLPSSVISSIVTIAWNSHRDRRDYRRDRRDVALEVALSLEKYARTCRAMMHKADWASDEAIRTNSGQPAHGVHVPEFTYPTVEWKWLHHKTTCVLRDFPVTVHYAREYVSSTRDYALALDICHEVEFECAKLAKRALALARLTRSKHGAARWNSDTTGSDLEREIDERIAASENRRKVMLDRATPLNAHMSADPMPTGQA
ncbi:hypothetical protein BZM26_36270 [Paraburkholderia strydomiana]|nr:hypothetical protein BZM26_36270 [Paraburkholderia strydomiana]